jgi:ribosomal protein S24E
LEILEERVNEFLGRRELRFEVSHEEGGTPKREEVRAALSAKLRIPSHKILIVNLWTPSGLTKTLGEAFIFPEGVKMDIIEPRLRRHLREGKDEGEGGR